MVALSSNSSLSEAEDAASYLNTAGTQDERAQ